MQDLEGEAAPVAGAASGIAIAPRLDSWTPGNRRALPAGGGEPPPENVAGTIRGLVILPQHEDI